jgi:hypothetical protein
MGVIIDLIVPQCEANGAQSRSGMGRGGVCEVGRQIDGVKSENWRKARTGGSCHANNRGK